MCPVALISLYFRTFNLTFGKGNRYLNFRYERTKHGPRVLLGRLCLSNSTRDMRKMLNNLGFNGDKYTEKSFKVSGVTAAMENGISLDDVALHGRWHCRETPRHYRQMSLCYRKNLALKLPL